MILRNLPVSVLIASALLTRASDAENVNSFSTVSDGLYWNPVDFMDSSHSFDSAIDDASIDSAAVKKKTESDDQRMETSHSHASTSKSQGTFKPHRSSSLLNRWWKNLPWNKEKNSLPIDPRYAKYANAFQFDARWIEEMRNTWSQVDITILLDDSISMCGLDGKSYISKKTGRIDTGFFMPHKCQRFDELMESLDLLLAAIDYVTGGEKGANVYFLNQPDIYDDVRYSSQKYSRLTHFLYSLRENTENRHHNAPKLGNTYSGAALNRIFNDQRNKYNDGRPHPMIVYFITDGDPSDPTVFDKAIIEREKYFFIAIRATTDRESDIQHLNELDKRVEFNLDVTDDYKGERNEIQWRFRRNFTFSVYLLKFLMGPFYSELDELDEAIGSNPNINRLDHALNSRLESLRRQVIPAIASTREYGNLHVPSGPDKLNAALNNGQVRVQPVLGIPVGHEGFPPRYDAAGRY